MTLHRSLSIFGFIALGVLLICVAIYWSFHGASDNAVSHFAALIAGLGLACITGGVVLFLRTVKLSN